MDKTKKWAVYRVPTKEARIFAGAKWEVVETFDNQQDAINMAESERESGYYDELVETYTAGLIEVNDDKTT